MAKCSLCKTADVIFAKTAASGGKKTIMLNALPDPRGTAWFEGPRGNALVVVASGDHPRPATGRFFRLHSLDCLQYQAKKRIESALKRAARQLGDA